MTRPLFSSYAVRKTAFVRHNLEAPRNALWWREDGKCVDYAGDPNDFFPAGRERIDAAIIERVKRFCFGIEDGASCPVQDACLQHGMRFEHFGIWGGMTPEERKHVRRRRSEPPPEPRASAPG